MSISKNRTVCPVIELFGDFSGGYKPWVTGDKELEDFLNQVLGFKTRGFCDREEFSGCYTKGLVQMGNGEIVPIRVTTSEGGYTDYFLDNGDVIKTRQRSWDGVTEYTLHLHLKGEKSPACWWRIDDDERGSEYGHVSFQKKFEGSKSDYFPQ
jgi:hypothetical protein